MYDFNQTGNIIFMYFVVHKKCWEEDLEYCTQVKLSHFIVFLYESGHLHLFTSGLD